jgi:hypothetical protein
MTAHIHEFYLPRIDLDLIGIDADTARQVVALLPAALERALAADQADQADQADMAGALPGSAQALADKAAASVASQVLTQTRQREGRA